MKSLNKINAIAEYKTLTKELLLFYLAANDFDTYSVWICRYNKDNMFSISAETKSGQWRRTTFQGVSKISSRRTT